jgi:hypothetical protein
MEELWDTRPRRGAIAWERVALVAGLVGLLIGGGMWGWHRLHPTPTVALVGQDQWTHYGSLAIAGRAGLPVETTQHVTVQNAAAQMTLQTGALATHWKGMFQTTARLLKHTSTTTETEGQGVWAWQSTVGGHRFTWSGQDGKVVATVQHTIETQGTVAERWTWNGETSAGSGVWHSRLIDIHGIPTVVGEYLGQIPYGTTLIDTKITYRYTLANQNQTINLSWNREEVLVRKGHRSVSITDQGDYTGVYLAPWMMVPPYPLMATVWQQAGGGGA